MKNRVRKYTNIDKRVDNFLKKLSTLCLQIKQIMI